MKVSASALFLAVLAVACASAATVSTIPEENVIASKANSHNLIVGKRQNGDKLMYQENISKGASIIGKKLIYEKTIYAPKDHVFTEVRALDMMTDGTGSFVVVTAGGPGQESISLRFKSQRFHGIYFILQAFAKPRN